MKKMLASFATLALLSVAATAIASPTAPLAASASAKAPFDRAFIDAMVPHHRLAIKMATIAKAAGLSAPVLVGIANAIIATQNDEIKQMLAWRKTWYGSSRIDPRGAMDLGLSMHGMGMEGDPASLKKAKKINAAFANMMINHHEGAVEMARLALKRAQHPQLKQLARKIIAGQTREIRVMRKYASGMTMHG